LISIRKAVKRAKLSCPVKPVPMLIGQLPKLRHTNDHFYLHSPWLHWQQ